MGKVRDDDRFAGLESDDEDSYDIDSTPGVALSEAEQLAALADSPVVRIDGYPIGSKRPRTMTASQTAFVDGILIGKTQRQAYQDAYPNAQGTAGNIASSAHKLTKHPLVSQALLEGWEMQAENLVDDQAAAKRWTIRQLLHCATTAKQEGTRIKALELVGKASGLFATASSAAPAPVTAAQLKRELAGHLTLLSTVKRSA